MTKRKLRILIVLNWLLTIIAATVFLSTRSSLPTEVRAYIENQRRAPGNTTDSILLWIDLSLLLLAILASIGLFLFKRWARNFLLFTYVFSLLLVPAKPIYIETGWTQLMVTLANMTGGMILALVYFSPISRFFDALGDR